jgi:hypothetical protein
MAEKRHSNHDLEFMSVRERGNCTYSHYKNFYCESFHMNWFIYLWKHLTLLVLLLYNLFTNTSQLFSLLGTNWR